MELFLKVYAVTAVVIIVGSYFDHWRYQRARRARMEKRRRAEMWNRILERERVSRSEYTANRDLARR